MKKRIIIAISVIVVLFIGIRMATAPTNLDLVQTIELGHFPEIDKIVPGGLPEKVAVAIDGLPAYDNNNKTQPTASTAKMLTALMVMEKRPFALGETGDTIKITPEYYNLYLYYSNNGGTNSVVMLGEEISEYDALAATLLPSSNNMADTLAIWAFGSLEDYKAYAENRLQEWGLKDTTIGKDASGFSESSTSTASDLAVIAQKLMENPVLAEIVSQKTHKIPLAGEIKNTNQLLGKHGIMGVKTGYIGDPSGYCLISAYKLNEHVVTISVLDSVTRADSFDKTEKIVEALQESLQETEIAKQSQEIGYYESWWSDKTPIVLSEDARAFAWSASNPSINLNMELPQEFQEATGSLDLTYGNTTIHYPVSTIGLKPTPSLLDRFLYAIFLK